jgi:hypothetical protein
MIPYKFTYFAFSLVMTIAWLILYYNRKDLRKQMLIMSVLMCFNTVLAQYFWWTHDWWRAETITGTRIGIEDFLAGFILGGVAAVLFPEIFSEREYKKPVSKKHVFVFFILVWNLPVGILYWGFHMNSALATCIVFALFGLIVVIERKDLFVDALVSGMLTLVGFIILWHILKFISPGWIEKTWFFDKLLGKQYFTIPIEDLLYYFFYGFFIGPLYEFVKGEGFRKYYNFKK